MLLAAVGIFVIGCIRRLLDVPPSMPTWLNTPEHSYLTGYVFNVTNPVEVVNGKKPVLQEVGPFVYKVITVKNSMSNVFNNDGKTLTYRPRKSYFIDLEKSISDPDKTFLIAPNIPFLSALSYTKNKHGFIKSAYTQLVLDIGRGSPFINVSVGGFLWGYNDELPCLRKMYPDHCRTEDNNDSDDEWDGWRRKKRSTEGKHWQDYEGFGNMGSFENCTCKWGFLRNANVTLRKPVTIYHGKGLVKEIDLLPTLNRWVRNSTCDKVGGQDMGRFPSGITKDDSLNIFSHPMCRQLELVFEKEIQYQKDLVVNRYSPSPNALGSHMDENPERRNEANACYCVDRFKCLRSGVLNLAPCMRSPTVSTGAPLAISYPHFYQADPLYLNAVEGLSPEKEKHQFYIDHSPKLGVPLAIRQRFQFNLIISRDEDIPIMSKFPEELVLPFFWVEDGWDHANRLSPQASQQQQN